MGEDEALQAIGCCVQVAALKASGRYYLAQYILQRGVRPGSAFWIESQRTAIHGFVDVNVLVAVPTIAAETGMTLKNLESPSDGPQSASSRRFQRLHFAFQLPGEAARDCVHVFAENRDCGSWIPSGIHRDVEISWLKFIGKGNRAPA